LTISDLVALVRIFVLPLLILFLITEGGPLGVPAAALFLIAVIADQPGLFRNRGSRPFEKLFGALAWKLLIASVLIALVQVGRAPGWVVILIVGKAFFEIGFRAISASQGVLLPRGELEPIETLLVFLAGDLLILDPWLQAVFPFSPGLVLLVAAVGVVLLSGVEAFRSFWRMVDLHR